jgi:hypothetical protein
MVSDTYYIKLMKMNPVERKNIIIYKLKEINNFLYINKDNICNHLSIIMEIVNVINKSLNINNEPLLIKSMYTIMTELIKITFALKNDKNINGSIYTYTSLHRYESIIIGILKIFLYYVNNKITMDFMYKIYYFIIKLCETPERECIIFNIVVLVKNIINCNNYLHIFATSNLKGKIELMYNDVIMQDTKVIITSTLNIFINAYPINPINLTDGYILNTQTNDYIQTNEYIANNDGNMVNNGYISNNGYIVNSNGIILNNNII